MRMTGLGKLLLFVIGLALVATAIFRFGPSLWRSSGSRLGASDAPGSTSAGSTAGSTTAAGSGAVPRLRLHGSNTIGSDLAPALVEKFLNREGATGIHRVPGAEDEVAVEGRLPGESEPVVVEIAAHGSGTAYEDLAAGTADIGMSSRRIKPDEKVRLAALGDMTSAAAEHVLGLDGVAVIVSRANRLESLTLDQIRDLFSGRIADWSSLGGPAGPVQIYSRDDRSGTFDTFKSLVLRDATLVSSAKRYEDSRKLSSDVAADPRGIGFVGLAYVGDAKALKVSEEGSVPYRPTVFTVRTEDYRLSRRLYLYVSPASANPWVGKFVQFALSDEGQAVVDAVGFVGQSLLNPVQEAAPALPTEVPAEYARLTKGSTRLPLVFRFETGSDRLDNKSLRDIGRLLESLSQPANRGRRVLLFGFADSLGSPEANRRLSGARATAVAGELRSEGVEAEAATGFGSALPVASNETEEGKGRNRRVEVWLK
ncbi:MAG: phosphate ABC transporter substrate-binding/OmpA family protein [Acidobacteriota bacterium]